MVEVGEAERKEIISRLRTVQGHLNGIEKMVVEGRECEDIMHQLFAIRSAVDKLTARLAEQYILNCHQAALSGGKNPEKEFLKAVKLLVKLGR